MSNFLIYPQVAEEVGQQGQRSIVVYKTAVRKRFLNKYYLIPVIKSRPVLSTTDVAALRIELMQEIHEEAYQVLCLQTFTNLLTTQGLMAMLDENQDTEVNRIAKFYGLKVNEPEVLEEDGKGGVRLKIVEDKEVIPLDKGVKQPTLKPGALPRKSAIRKQNAEKKSQEAVTEKESPESKTTEGDKAETK